MSIQSVGQPVFNSLQRTRYKGPPISATPDPLFSDLPAFHNNQAIAKVNAAAFHKADLTAQDIASTFDGSIKTILTTEGLTNKEKSDQIADIQNQRRVDLLV
jgi:hypothetical protein